MHVTVLSCPVRLSKVWQAVIEAWYGIAGQCPVQLGQVQFGSAKLCRVWRFLARSGCAGWATMEQCFVWRGGVFRGSALLRRCMVWMREALNGVAKSGPVKHCYAWRGRLSSWFGEVLIGVVGRSGVLLGRVLLRFGNVMWGLARRSFVRQASVSLRLAAAVCGFVRPVRARFCWLLSRPGMAKQGADVRAAVRCSKARFSPVPLGMVLQSWVKHRDVRFCVVYGNARLQK